MSAERGTLPELPEGYFFRVQVFDCYGQSLNVQLRKKRRWLGSSLIKARLSNGKNGETIEDTIERWAQELTDWLADSNKREQNQNYLLALEGDYPPKKWVA